MTAPNPAADPHDLWPAPGGPVPGADGPSPEATAGFRMNHTMVSRELPHHQA